MSSYYRVVGTGSQVSEPMEKVVITASEAAFFSAEFRRLCGRHGTVDVWRKDGRRISPQMLDSMVQKEKLEAPPLN